MTKSLNALFLAAAIAGNAFTDTLILQQDPEDGSIHVLRKSGGSAILTQNAASDFRPYIHPILAPDGNGLLTELRPKHHLHQTGIYWGFTRANGRDYFGHPEKDYWRRVSCNPLINEGDVVQWETVYQMLDESGQVVMVETQRWTLQDKGDRYLLDLRWSGEAVVDLTIANFFYGGLFVRMPWSEGIDCAATNSTGHRDRDADSRRSLWLDVGVAIEGRDDWGHIAILEHPDNPDFPQPWRMDKQFGFGPSRAKLGGWQINAGETDAYRHRLIIYTGEIDADQLNQDWLEYSGKKTLPPPTDWPGGPITRTRP